MGYFMNIAKELQKVKIIPQKELNIDKKMQIANCASNMLSNNISELLKEYNELYMRIYNCKMYYALMPSEYNGVVYFYKNNTIYFNENIENINEFVLHEIIHYLQNFNKIANKEERIGLCSFLDFKLQGLGINEAVVQYITAKAIKNEPHRVNTREFTLYTNSENYYKYMTSLILQIVFLLNPQELIESCFKGTIKFENDMYNAFEEKTEKIIKNFDLILDENNKLNRDEKRIVDIYIETQEIIYTTYFNKLCKRLTTKNEIDECVEKLKNYENIIGKRFNEDDEKTFQIFKNKIEEKLNRKYIDISMERTKNLLAIKENRIFSLWKKFVKLF